MKLRNKRLAAGIMAVAFAVAMPASAFASEETTVSGADSYAYTAEDFKNDATNAVTAFVNGDTETVKGYFDAASDSVKDSLGITEEDEAAISEEVNSVIEKAKEVVDQVSGLTTDSDETITMAPAAEEEIVAEEEEVASEEETTEEEATTEESKKIFWVDGVWGLNLQVHPGYNVELPDQLLVTYTDGTKGYANVTWTETDNKSPVDATKHNTIFEGTDGEWGFFFIHAHVEGYGTVIAIKVRITAKAPIPEEPEEPIVPDEPVVPEEPTEPTEPEDTNKPSGDLNTSETIENVQTGENDLTMVWVLFMFSASAMAVGFTSRKFRHA